MFRRFEEIVSQYQSHFMHSSCSMFLDSPTLCSEFSFKDWDYVGGSGDSLHFGVACMAYIWILVVCKYELSWGYEIKCMIRSRKSTCIQSNAPSSLPHLTIPSVQHPGVQKGNFKYEKTMFCQGLSQIDRVMALEHGAAQHYCLRWRIGY
jgi:hypothetical protein